MKDRSNGYEGVAAEFLPSRGRAPLTAIGTKEVRGWARTLPLGAAVIDLVCGSGFPITASLVSEGLSVYAVDAAPSLVKAFRRNLPEIPFRRYPELLKNYFPAERPSSASIEGFILADLLVEGLRRAGPALARSPSEFCTMTGF